eukprot:6309068-Amphidinium_carterae.1
MAVEPSNRLHSAMLGDRSDYARKTKEMMTTFSTWSATSLFPFSVLHSTLRLLVQAMSWSCPPPQKPPNCLDLLPLKQISSADGLRCLQGEVLTVHSHVPQILDCVM